MDPSLGVDRPLADELVAQIVEDRFSIGVTRAALVGEGWVNEIFDVHAKNGHWYFRFPKRAEAVVDLEREIALMPAFEDALAVPIPRFELVGIPGDDFPYPFVGYRPIEGVAADKASPQDRPGFSRDIATFLTQIHGIDPEAIPPWPHADGASWWPGGAISDLVDAAEKIRSRVAEQLLDEVEPFLRGTVTPPSLASELRVLHGDLCPDHVIVHPGTGALAGVIDFADAEVGDPIFDFIGLATIGGWELVREVKAEYGHPLEAGFDERLRFAAKVLNLRWLGQASEGGGMTYHQRTDVAKHQSWVVQAFEQGDLT